MTFYKILATLVIALLVFSSSVFSILDEKEEFPKEKGHSLARTPTTIKDGNEKEEKSCSKWGLFHWFSGIGEYIQFCFCCPHDKKSGLYVTHYIDENGKEYFVRYSDCQDAGGDRCVATCCCPLAAFIHLCDLPSACCECSPKEFHSSQRDGDIDD